MATNQLSLLRQWNMLRMLPRAPGKITAQELANRLRDAEFPVTERTIQRDLLELAAVFPLVVDDRDKPFGWSWQRDGSSFDLPGLSLPEALTLTLVEQSLRHQLPPSTVDALQPHFKSAARVLSSVDDAAMSKAWLNKIRTIAPQQPLLAPALDAECQRTVYLAVMQERQLRLHYRKRDAARDTVYDAVHPLAIVQRGGLIYLVCMFGDHDDPRTIVLHRMQKAELRFEPARPKADFCVDKFIASGEFGIIAGGPITLHAVFARAAGEHLQETPLAFDQVLDTADPLTIRLTATVPHTRALVWWLLGFGDGVEVVAPPELRAELAQTAARMAAVYARTAGQGAAVLA